MIVKNCDNCDRVLEVPEDQAGTKLRCPDCGDINLIPVLGAAGGARAAPTDRPAPATAAAAPSGPAPASGAGSEAASGAPDRAVAAGYPPDSGPEQPVLLVRPAMFRARPLSFTAGMLGLIAAIVGGFYFGFSQERQWIMWPCIVVAVALAVVFIVWKIHTMSAALEVTNKRTVERRGLFSRATSEVLHDSIRNVTVRQTFWERVWGVGEIGIASSGHEGVEVKMKRLAHPNRVREIIDLYRPL